MADIGFTALGVLPDNINGDLPANNRVETFTSQTLICTEYRTTGSGFFHSIGIWEKRHSPDDAWEPALVPPVSGDAVYIRHEIDLTADFTVANCPFSLEKDNLLSKLIIGPLITLKFNGDLDVMTLCTYYGLRFQVEFLIRDAKQHAGLEDCMARDEQKLHNHFNIALSNC